VLHQTALLSTVLVQTQVAHILLAKQHRQNLLAKPLANQDVFLLNVKELIALKLNALMHVITQLLVLFLTALFPTAQSVALEVTATLRQLITLLAQHLSQLHQFNMFARMLTQCAAHLDTVTSVSMV